MFDGVLWGILWSKNSECSLFPVRRVLKGSGELFFKICGLLEKVSGHISTTEKYVKHCLAMGELLEKQVSLLYGSASLDV
jgi:hypothetical protein